MVSAQKIFITDWRLDADAIMTITKDKAKADLIVYKTNDVAQANGNSGIWKFVFIKTTSDKRIFISLDEQDCDFKVYFTTNIKEAGWVNLNKKYLLEKH
jgi:hypothetical protein